GAAPASKASRAREEAALSVDSSIFDYDGVYDSMKEGQRSIQAKHEKENAKRDPKYMSASFAASEQRKIDRQRAEAKKIQREREQEGDLYENTESFVTDAYKQQMEDIRKAEDDEKKNESSARQKNKGAASFFKEMLGEQDRAHQAAVEASIRPAASTTEPKEESDDNESRRKARIDEARQKGLDVRTNEENEVVDERSLLSAGLNTFSNQNKRQKTESDERSRRNDKDRDPDDLHHSHRKLPEMRDARQAQRERQSRMMEEQMLALQKEREEEEAKQEAERKKAIVGKKRNDTDRIELARQRALERRKNK
ncbi:uncharacterized protein FA14DRAFT_110493, partial [Meira miltonrushii]